MGREPLEDRLWKPQHLLGALVPGLVHPWRAPHSHCTRGEDRSQQMPREMEGRESMECTCVGAFLDLRAPRHLFSVEIEGRNNALPPFLPPLGVPFRGPLSYPPFEDPFTPPLPTHFRPPSRHPPWRFAAQPVHCCRGDRPGSKRNAGEIEREGVAASANQQREAQEAAV